MYTLQMWNSYLFVASLDVLVVLLAGFISIFSLRRSQKAIEKVSLALALGPAIMTCATVKDSCQLQHVHDKPDSDWQTCRIGNAILF